MTRAVTTRGLQVRFAVVLGVLAMLAAVATSTAVAASPPSIDGEAASAISEQDATLEAQINPNGAYTAYEFQIFTDPRFNYTQMACPLVLPGSAQCMAIIAGEPLPPGLHEPPQGNLSAGSGDQSVSLDLASAGSTLQPETTYYYRVIASNGGQVVEGETKSFTTASAPAAQPTIEGEGVSNITANDATLEAQINPGNLQTNYSFRLESGCLPPLACLAIATYPLPSGEIPASANTQTVSLDLQSAGVTLRPGTRYRFSVEASNPAGSTEGEPQIFTTPAATSAPLIEAESLSNLTPTDATLEAKIDTEGLETSYQFKMWSSPCSHHQSGCELILDVPLPSGKLLGSFLGQSVSLDLGAAGVSLTPGGEYGYSVSASNSAGSAEDPWQVFEAPDPRGSDQTSTPADARPLGAPIENAPYSSPAVNPSPARVVQRRRHRHRAHRGGARRAKRGRA